MKKSKLRQIIQEEIKAVLELDGVNRTINDKFKAAMGFKAPEGGPGNKMKQTYEFIVKYWENRGEDKNFFTTGPIKATSEEEAYKIAKAKADEFAEEEFVKIDSIKLKN
jgi:hypothetical protein